LLVLLLGFGFLFFIFMLTNIFGFLLPILLWGAVLFLLSVCMLGVDPCLFPVIIWGVGWCLRCLWSCRVCILRFRLLLKVVIFYRILWCLAVVCGVATPVACTSRRRMGRMDCSPRVVVACMSPSRFGGAAL